MRTLSLSLPMGRAIAEKCKIMRDSKCRAARTCRRYLRPQHRSQVFISRRRRKNIHLNSHCFPEVQPHHTAPPAIQPLRRVRASSMRSGVAKPQRMLNTCRVTVHLDSNLLQSRQALMSPWRWLSTCHLALSISLTSLCRYVSTLWAGSWLVASTSTSCSSVLWQVRLMLSSKRCHKLHARTAGIGVMLASSILSTSAVIQRETPY